MPVCKNRIRRRLVIMILVLGLPVMLVGIGIWYLSSGRLERFLEREYSLQGFHGKLRLGALELESADQVRFGLTSIDDADGQTQLTIDRLTVNGSVMGRSIDGIALKDVDITIDPDNKDFMADLYDSVYRFILARPPTEIPRIKVSLQDVSCLLGPDLELRIDDLMWDNRDGAGVIETTIYIGDNRIILSIKPQEETDWEWTWSIDGDSCLPLHDFARACRAAGFAIHAEELVHWGPECLILGGSYGTISRHAFTANLRCCPDGGTDWAIDTLLLDGTLPYVGASKATMTVHWQPGAGNGALDPLVLNCSQLDDRWLLEVREGKAPVRRLVARSMALGGQPAMALVDYLHLPSIATIAGTSIQVPDDFSQISGRARTEWMSGSSRLRTDFVLRTDGMTLDDLSLRAKGLLEIEGRLRVDYDGSGGVGFTRLWVTPVLLSLTGRYIPANGLLPLLQEGIFTWSTATTGGYDLNYQGSGTDGGLKRELCVALPDRGEMMVTGRNLPLALVDGMVDSFVFGGGNVDSMQIIGEAVDQHPQNGEFTSLRIAGTVSKGEAALADWALVGARSDVALSFVDDAAGNLSFSFITLDFPESGGSFSWRELPDGRSRLNVDSGRIDAFLKPLHAPIPLPASQGAVHADVTLDQRQEGDLRAFVHELKTTDLDLGDIVAKLDLTARDVAVNVSREERPHPRVRVDWTFAGEVQGGTGHLFGESMDIGKYKPAVRGEFTYIHPDARLDIHQLQLRSGGDDVRTAYTSGIRGSLMMPQPGEERVLPTGHLQVVIDPVDLAFLTTELPWLELAGEHQANGPAALMANLRMNADGGKSFDGWLLPRGANLDLMRGSVVLEGLRGALRFPVQELRLREDLLLEQLQETPSVVQPTVPATDSQKDGDAP